MFRSVFERGARLGAGPVLRLWRSLLSFFSRWWQIESLYRANAKYRPIWEPRFLLFEKSADLPRIGIAAARAEGFLEAPGLPKWLHRGVRSRGTHGEPAGERRCAGRPRRVGAAAARPCAARWRGGGWRAVPMTLAAVGLTALTQIVQNQSWGYRPVQDIGAVRAEDPLWLALLRTPLSLFVPALDLPVWGALAQILVVFGIAEICLGRRRTLLVAYTATLAGTLYARVGLALGPGGPFGLPASDALVVDTGPSAAVVGLAVFVGWRYRAYTTAAAVIVAMVVEVVLKNNLAGREHLAAIAATAILYACLRRRDRTAGAARRGRQAPGSENPVRRSSPGTCRRAPTQRRSWR